MSNITSPLSGPLRVDLIPLPNGAAIGMCHCPGRTGTDGRSRRWQRSLNQDVDAIWRAGFSSVLSLLGDEELEVLGAGRLGQRLSEAGLDWYQFSITDFGVPGPEHRQAWESIQADLLQRLASGEQVLVHCAAGLGRTGTLVAVLLRALGDDAATAIQRVRAIRPGTLETAAQEAFVAAWS